MILRVLGASGAEFPGFNPPAFLIDGAFLLDAGTIGAVLDEDAQWDIRDILLTHSHLDHIRGIPFLADNIIMKNKKHSVTIMGIPATLDTLKTHLLNGTVWPDFTKIPNAENPVLKLKPITLNKAFKLNGYKFTAYHVSHTVPAVGYVVESPDGRRLLYTGDTGPSNEIWRAAAKPLHAAIIEVSMPNDMHDMAILTGHLTADLLEVELAKMKLQPDMILITHPKPQHLKVIEAELKALKRKSIRLLKSGDRIEV